MELDLSEKLHSLLFSLTLTVPERISFQKIDNLRRRKAYGFALSANSAWKSLVDRNATASDMKALGEEGFYIVSQGQREFSMRQALWLAGGGKVSCFDLSNLTTSEDMYVYDEVSEARTLKVGGITLRPMLWGIPTKTVTTSKIGLWQIGKSMYDWAENLTRRLILAGESRRPLLL
jgi:hypothetical protein